MYEFFQEEDLKGRDLDMNEMTIYDRPLKWDMRIFSRSHVHPESLLRLC